MKYITAFWDWVDNRVVVRRILTLGTFVMTVWAIQWAMVFAYHMPRSGAEVAMIISAVMVPLATLQGYLFSAYSKGREA